ncbi:MAG: reverse transcriptase-like protein, partial [Nanoarchaeota archaeon]
SVTGGNPGKGEYRGVNTETGEVLFEYQFPTKVSNNVAEFLAIVDGIKYLRDNNLKLRIIYSDSKIAINWVTWYGYHRSNMDKHYPELYTSDLDALLKNANKFIAGKTESDC